MSLAEEVVNGIDLPEIIRESTGTMASEVVRDARMQSIVADVAIARLVDRIIHQRRALRTDAPGEAESRARVNLPEPTDETQTQQLLPPQPESPKQELRRQPRPELVLGGRLAQMSNAATDCHEFADINNR